MGCCSDKARELLISHSRNNSNLYATSDECLNTSTEIPFNVNDPIGVIDGICMNPLGYALYKGQIDNFKLLQEEKGANIENMELLFEKQRLISLELIIANGHYEIYKYYLPTFLLLFKKKIDYTETFKKPLIHIAIEKENFEIIKFTYEYFFFVNPPPAFDFHYIDPLTGENSAFVACRTGNLKIIQYLNEVCGVNFSGINAEGLNTLHAVIGTNRRGLGRVKVVKYLIQICKVDFVFEFEKFLIRANDEKILKFVKKELKKIGIQTNREELISSLSKQNILNGNGYIYVEDTDQMITTINSISFIDSDLSSVYLLKNPD